MPGPLPPAEFAALCARAAAEPPCESMPKIYVLTRAAVRASIVGIGARRLIEDGRYNPCSDRVPGIYWTRGRGNTWWAEVVR